MKHLATARVLADGLDLTRKVLVDHVERGTVTPPLGFVENAGGRRDYLWEPDSSPTLDLLGATALVPASDEIALKEIKRGFYATPCRSSGHLGRYDGFPALGLCHKGHANIYPVIASVRIGYLDPVRENERGWQAIPTAEGDRIIDAARLSDTDRDTLRSVCRSRAALHGDDHLMVDPREIAVYKLAIRNPIATGVETESIVRGASWTIDPIDESTTSVDTCTLDQVAQWSHGPISAHEDRT